MVIKLRTSYLLPAELSETTSRYLKVLANSLEIDPFITKIAELLKNDVEQLNRAITAVRLNRLVNQVAEADAIRDDLFIGFRDMVDAGKRRRSSAFEQAYQQVWPIIEKAGITLYNLGYAEQSGKMEALFKELDSEENQAHLSTLLVADIYAELKNAQSAFNNLYSDRLAEDLRLQYPTLDEAKRSTVPHVNIFLGAISILGETENDAYQHLVDQLNGITTEIMTVARARRARADNQSEESDEVINADNNEIGTSM